MLPKNYRDYKRIVVTDYDPPNSKVEDISEIISEEHKAVLEDLLGAKINYLTEDNV